MTAPATLAPGCPLGWARGLGLAAAPVPPACHEAHRLAAWLRARGWTFAHGGGRAYGTTQAAPEATWWRHPDLPRVRQLNHAAHAQTVMDAQVVLEPRGWRLASGVVAKTRDGRVLWLDVLELHDPRGAIERDLLWALGLVLHLEAAG